MRDQSIPLSRWIAHWIILLLVIPVLLLLSLEGLGLAYIWAKYGVAGKSYGLWAYDAELGAIHAKNGYNRNSETNDYGFRNRENVYEPKPAGALRIITYGDSTTFCYQLVTDDAWPIRLQILLRSNHHSRDQVLNAGAIGWSIAHQITRAERDLPVLKPDYVILYSGMAEELNAEFAAAEGKDLAAAVQQHKRLFSTNAVQTNWLQRNSVLMRAYEQFIGARFRFAAAPQQTSAIDPNVITHYLSVLEDFITLIKKHGATPVYVITTGLPIEERPVLVSRAGGPLAREKGAIVIDAQAMYDAYDGNKKDLFADGSAHHFSELGAKRLAEFIFANMFVERLKTPK